MIGMCVVIGSVIGWLICLMVFVSLLSVMVSLW